MTPLPAPQPRREPYRRPRLTVYGGVSDLTRGSIKSAMSDSGKNSMWTS